jgi:putative ABC transport system substrate-binding protein
LEVKQIADSQIETCYFWALSEVTLEIPKRRREFLTLIGGAVAALPPAARAQQPTRMFRICFAAASNENDPDIQAGKAAFRNALRKLGWIDGINIRLEYHFGVTTEERALATAAEVVRSAPDAILAIGLQNAQALQRETRTIPILFMSANEPVERGIVESLARPSGNLRPYTSYGFPIGGK